MVCQSVAVVSPTKTVEPIEVPLRLRTPKEAYITWAPDAHVKGSF